MKNNELIGPLREIASDYDAVSQGLFDLASVLERQIHYEPKERLYNAVRIAERNTVDLRNVTARTMWGHTDPFYEDVAGMLRISVSEEPRWIKIVVPAILPNRNNRDNSEFLTKPLRNSILRFQRQEQIGRFKNCMVCIVHGYDEALSLRRIRDYDNIETKRYLDVIESMLLVNDGGLLCSVLQTTEIMDRDCTVFYLMQPETLPIWAQDHIKSR